MFSLPSRASDAGPIGTSDDREPCGWTCCHNQVTDDDLACPQCQQRYCRFCVSRMQMDDLCDDCAEAWETEEAASARKRQQANLFAS